MDLNRSDGVTFSLGLVAREGRRDELVKTLGGLLGPIRGSAGCLRCNLLEDLQQPNDIQVLVQWRSREDFERHVKTDAFGRLLIAMELAAEHPKLEIRSVAGIRGMDLLRQLLDGEDDRPRDPRERRPAEEQPDGETE